jgi:hypothetical protein
VTTFVAREGKSDAAITAELVERLGRVATVAGKLSRAVVEAQVRGATLVVFGGLPERPAPWPRDAGLVVVADEAPSWM